MKNPNAATLDQIKNVLMRIVRDNLFGGRELALIEPVNGPRPGEPHAAIGFLSAKAEPHEVYQYDDREDGFFEELRGERRCRFRITFFGRGAETKAIECQNLFQSTNRLFDFAPIAGFGEAGEVQDASTEYLGHYEERAFLNIELYANIAAEYPAGWIRNVHGDIVRDGLPDPYLFDHCPQEENT